MSGRVGNVNNLVSIQNIATFYIAGRTDGYPSVYLNHVTFFNRALTQSEISYIHRYSGIIPPGAVPGRDPAESTHAACVAHYVADRQGRTMWDVVEQYNYAKFFNQASVNNWYNYSIALRDNNSYTYSGSSTTAQAFSTGVQTGFRKGSLIRLKVEVTSAFDNNLTFAENAYIGLGNIFTIPKEVGVYEFEAVAVTNSNVEYGRFLIETSTTKGSLIIHSLSLSKVLTAQHGQLINYTDSEVGLPDPTSQTVYKDFYTKQTYQWWRAGSPGDASETPLIEQKSLLQPLQNALRIKKSASQYLKVSKFTPSNEQGFTFLFIGTCIDISGNPALFDYYHLPTNTGFIISLTKSTPYHRVTIDKYINNLKTSFFTHFIDDAIFQNLFQVIFTITPTGLTTIHLNGRKVAQSMLSPIAFDQNVSLGIGRLLSFGSYYYLDAHTIAANIAKGVATPRQVKELYNNTLLRQPLKSWQNLDWQLLPNFNKIIDTGSPGDTANVPGQYLLEDLSGKNNTIEAVGYNATQGYSVIPLRQIKQDNAVSSYVFQPEKDIRGTGINTATLNYTFPASFSLEVFFKRPTVASPNGTNQYAVYLRNSPSGYLNINYANQGLKTSSDFKMNAAAILPKT